MSHTFVLGVETKPNRNVSSGENQELNWFDNKIQVGHQMADLQLMMMEIQDRKPQSVVVLHKIPYRCDLFVPVHQFDDFVEIEQLHLQWTHLLHVLIEHMIRYEMYLHHQYHAKSVGMFDGTHVYIDDCQETNQIHYLMDRKIFQMSLLEGIMLKTDDH